MHQILRVRIALSSFVSLFACVYVRWLNHFGSILTSAADIHFIGLIMVFFALEKYAFIFPFIGLVLTLVLPKIKRLRFIHLVPDILYGFAFIWVCLAFLIWFAQFDSRLDVFIRQ
jgi:hypothetical protein